MAIQLHRKPSDTNCPGRSPQGSVPGRKRKTFPHGQVEVNRIVGRKPTLPPEGEDGGQLANADRVVDLNGETPEQVKEPEHIDAAKPSAPFSNQKHVGHFDRPKGGHNSNVSFRSPKDRIRVRIGFVFEAPRHRDRAIQDESAQRRPCSIMAWSEMPPRRRPLRKARSAATTSAIDLGRLSLAGTSIATGTPCRVIVTRFPFATRSRSRGNCVLAS